MNHMTLDSTDAPWNDSLETVEYCDNCHNLCSEIDPPLNVDGKTICPACISEARNYEFITPVAKRTNKLKKDFLNNIGQRLWELACDNKL